MTMGPIEEFKDKVERVIAEKLKYYRSEARKRPMMDYGAPDNVIEDIAEELGILENVEFRLKLK